jgi:hypothetical protein
MGHIPRLTPSELGTQDLVRACLACMYRSSLARSRCRRAYVLPCSVPAKLFLFLFSLSSCNRRRLQWNERLPRMAGERVDDACTSGKRRPALRPAATRREEARLCILISWARAARETQARLRTCASLLYVTALVLCRRTAMEKASLEGDIAPSAMALLRKFGKVRRSCAPQLAAFLSLVLG